MSRKTELELFESFQHLAEKHGRVEELAQVDMGKFKLPIYSLVLGKDDPSLPTFGLFAGVHGLERVGSHVALHYLKSLFERMEWDEPLQSLFEKVRLVSIPIINPGGLYNSTRSNPQGVDIMRNAPVESESGAYQLVSGHRISPKLPWYRGDTGNMEVETQALVSFVQKEMFASQFSMALDVHSGFGVIDRVWYPYSHSTQDFPDIPTVKSFKKLLNKSLPHNVYKVEKQTDSYVINGDPWDWLYLQHHEQFGETDRTFVPWCLEMGSWSWLRKNPLQIFSKPGLFNPVLPHRYKRIMRRHLNLLDLFLRATTNHKNWSTAWQDGSSLGA